MQVNILEAKTDLSKLIRLIETGAEQDIVIARYGKPIVVMTRYQEVPVSRRIGIGKGVIQSPKDFDEDNAMIAKMMGGSL